MISRNFIQLLSLLVLSFISTLPIYSQEYYRVYFSDKGEFGTSLDEAGIDFLQDYLKPSSIERRLRNLSASTPEDYLFFSDLPVSQLYIDSIISIGGTWETTSRWNNYAVFAFSDDDSTAHLTVAQFSFVDSVENIISLPSDPQSAQLDSSAVLPLISTDCGSGLDYGFADNQISGLHLEEMHAMGWLGQGVNIAVIDNGFRTYHKALSHVRIMDRWDFIQKDSIVSYQPGDHASQDNHGTPVLGTMAAYMNGELIGSAPFANFYLYKTENMRGENPIEEEYFAAAVERAEMMGCDIITASLGYRNFDNAQANRLYEDLDGVSTIPARAMNRAAELGVICISSAGNNGGNSPSILSPADAIGVLAIGALVADHESPSSFSSAGPSFDGRIKPELVAQGTSVATVPPYDSTAIMRTNGTSFSAPLVAGAFATLLSASPKNVYSQQLIENVIANAKPIGGEINNRTGYGMPDIWNTYTSSFQVATPPQLLIFDTSDGLFARIYIKTDMDQPQIAFEISRKGSKRLYPAKRFYESDLYFIDLQVDSNEIIDVATATLESNQEIYQTYLPHRFQITDSWLLCSDDESELSRLSPNAPDLFAYFSDDRTLQINYQTEFTRSFVLNIHDVSGRLVFAASLPQSNKVGEYELDVQPILPAGHYFISLASDSDIISSFGIVKTF